MIPRSVPRRRRARRALALLGSGLFGVALAVVPAQAAGHPSPSPGTAGSPTAVAPAARATFGGGPANARGLDGRTYFQFLTQAGSTATDLFGVVNLGHTTLTLNVYAVDATSGTDGTFTYPPRTTRPRDAGSWLSLGTPGARSTVTVAPQHTVVLPLRVVVPPNASPGDHAAGLVVSLSGKVTASTGSSGTSATFEQRVATKVILRVAGPLHPRLTITGLRGRYLPGGTLGVRGRVRVTYVVRNTGNVLLGGLQSVRVTGLLTSARAPAMPQIPALIPGAAFPVTVDVPGVWAMVRLTAHAHVTPLALAGSVTPALTAPSATSSLWAVPWLLLLLVAAAVLFVAGGRRLRRRRLQGPSPAPRHLAGAVAGPAAPTSPHDPEGGTA